MWRERERESINNESNLKFQCSQINGERERGKEGEREVLVSTL